jgi:cytochrome b subunit of formate dehydrogenase
LAIEFSNIINSDFKNNEDLEWLKKITKKETKKKEILEFKKFIDKIKSLE